MHSFAEWTLDGEYRDQVSEPYGQPCTLDTYTMSFHLWCMSWSVVHVLRVSPWVCTDFLTHVLVWHVTASVLGCDVSREWCKRDPDLQSALVPMKTMKRKLVALT